MLGGISRLNALGVFSIVFFWLFAIYDVNFHGPDEPIYFAYTASLVEDGDLNVVNQYPPSDKIEVSSTYNLLDLHNHGGVIVWVPFYIYGKTVHLISKALSLPVARKYSADQLITCSLSLSTVIFGFLTLILTYILSRSFFSKSLAFFSTAVVFLGTPFFYYMLFEPANANILASFFSVLLICFGLYASNRQKDNFFWFLYGAFFSICITIKVDLWFHISFILIFFLYLVISKRISWKLGGYFILGIIPGMALKTINDFIKYGVLRIGEFNLFSGRDYFHLDQLFSSYGGFLYTSPVLYICFLGFLLAVSNLFKQIKNKKFFRLESDVFFTILSLYVAVKILCLGYRYAWGGGTVGARILLTEFPVFVLLIARFFYNRRPILKYVFYILVCLFIIWNFIIISEFISGVDLEYMVSPPGLFNRFKMLSHIFPLLGLPQNVNLKLGYFLPLVITLLGALYCSYSNKIKAKDALSGELVFQVDARKCSLLKSLTIYALSAYFMVTVFNLYNNQRNVDKLKLEGYLNKSTVLKPSDFGKSENMSSMDEMIKYFQVKGDIHRVNKIKTYKNQLYRETGNVR